MSIRYRLTIAISSVMMITLVVLGFAIVQTTRSTLIDQVDEQLLAYEIKRGEGESPSQRLDDKSSEDPPGYRLFYELEIDPQGKVLRQALPGMSDDPESPPKVPDLAAGRNRSAVATRALVTIRSQDGDIRYRMLVEKEPDGGYSIVATSLESVDEAVQRLLRTIVLVTAIALALAVAISSVLIRRGLRPVDRMVDTAATIATGDLSSRVPNPDPDTELGRLATALNEMMSHIETADAERSAGEQRLRRFVADAAHELRTPLTSVRGYAELFRQGALATTDAVSNAMGRIESESARMARLVDDLLLLARLDQQRGLEREPVDLAALVRDAITDFRVVEPLRTVTDRIANRAMVYGDQLRLRQVIDNLFSNVRTHTPPGSALDVVLREADGQAVLEVRDDGPGISTEDRERVFERFWRADPARTRSRGGTGLGLAIVASLVGAHGGTIEIESGAGEGTLFRVRIPSASVGEISPYRS